MMPSESSQSVVPPDAPEVAQAAFQDWQAGNQASAIERVRKRADQDELWAVTFLVWLLTQQGLPGFEVAVPYARKAIAFGAPWAVGHLVNNMFANVASAPQFLEPALDLADKVYPSVPGLDVVGQAWNLLSQGRAQEAVRLMGLRGSFPLTPAGWDSLVKQAEDGVRAITDCHSSVRQVSAQVETLGHEADDAIQKAASEVETKARQAGLLVSTINASATNSLFDAEAARNESESRISWRWGIAVLAAAALFAVLPIVLHYVGRGPTYTAVGVLGAHAGATAALGTVAGVLLSRARARDRAHQRARDISTAMGTMISYSNQIVDESEKQRFMLTMGQLVLQAHLQGDGAPAKDDALSGLANLVSVVRQQGSSAS